KEWMQSLMTDNLIRHTDITPCQRKDKIGERGERRVLEIFNGIFLWVPRCFRWNGVAHGRAGAAGPPGESPAATTENSPAIYRWAQSRRPGSPAGTKEC